MTVAVNKPMFPVTTGIEIVGAIFARNVINHENVLPSLISSDSAGDPAFYHESNKFIFNRINFENFIRCLEFSELTQSEDEPFRDDVGPVTYRLNKFTFNANK